MCVQFRLYLLVYQSGACVLFCEKWLSFVVRDKDALDYGISECFRFLDEEGWVIRCDIMYQNKSPKDITAVGVCSFVYDPKNLARNEGCGILVKLTVLVLGTNKQKNETSQPDEHCTVL